jgi:hypothetical protein
MIVIGNRLFTRGESCALHVGRTGCRIELRGTSGGNIRSCPAVASAHALRAGR